MKIKKMYQGTAPENKILNTHSNSKTDVYSCDYINNLKTTIFEASTFEECLGSLASIEEDFSPYRYIDVYFTSYGIPEPDENSGNAISNVLRIDLTKPSFNSLLYYDNIDWRYGASNFYPDAQFFVGYTHDPGFFMEGAFINSDKDKLLIGKMGYYQITSGYAAMLYSDTYEKVSKVVGYK